jgi:putative PIG3 family NAD(P)H quinone oxidoreductase
VLPVPAGLSFVEAAGLPEVAFTVWTNVFERGRLAKGESLLVHGGASGIGTHAVQLAAARGARVFATAGTDAKCALCERLGAERAINYRVEDFLEIVRAQTGERGVDVILDMVGGDYLPRNVRALATDGRLVNIAFLRGSRVELDFMRVMLKRLTLTGSTLRARSVAEKGAIAQALGREVWPLIEAGEVRPVIDSTYPLAEAAAAHRRIDDPEHAGKIVLEVDPTL